MNQKALKYVLITGLVLVWGTIIYKVINGLGNNDTVTTGIVKASSFNYDMPKDSFSLWLDYSDPFMPGSEEEVIEDTVMNNTAPAKEIIPPKPGYDLARIQYHGMIINPEQKKRVALVSIGGKEYMAKEKDRIDEVLIRRITNDRLSISVNGKMEEINKQMN